MNFDAAAAKWDTQDRIDRAMILVEAIRSATKDAGGKIALEIGCGTGLVTLPLCQDFQEIYAVDSSGGMRNVLAEKVKSCSITNIHPCSTEILDEPKWEEKFDVIYSSMAFHHIIDIPAELAILRSVLKQDGMLIIVDLDSDQGLFHADDPSFDGHNGFDRSWLQALMEEGGFSNVTMETVYSSERIMMDNTVVPYSLFLCSAAK